MVVVVASCEQRQRQCQWRREDALVTLQGTPIQFLRSLSMCVLVVFCSRHFAGTPPQTMVSAARPSPNGPLGDESMPQYFRGIFHSYMGTIPKL